MVEAAQGCEVASEPVLLCRILWDWITGENRNGIHAERKRDMRKRARGQIYANYFAADKRKIWACSQLLYTIHKTNDPPPIPVVEYIS
jgi:hypothetical protein